jgi:K+-transporting ATPase ATPase C chain
MKRDSVTSAIGIIVFTILLGLVYPLVITGISQVAFPGDANGQQIKVDGKLVGSKLIGQSFASPVIGKNGKPEEKEEELVTEADPRYFQSRPSATEGGAYNAAASTFSNHGPNSVKTKEADEENIKAYLELNKNPVTKAEYDPGLTVATIPVDAVNSSASGLDPEISEANAWIQAHRVAAVRHLSLVTVNGLISKYTSGRGLGFSGEPGVNVLELNLALDRLSRCVPSLSLFHPGPTAPGCRKAIGG